MSAEVAREKVRPIKPEEIPGTKIQDFPDAVIESFNELIVQKATGGSIIVLQNDVVELMVEKGLHRGEIFEKGWLNVENVYRKAGWDVTYDKPGFNEPYPASFTFEPSKRRDK